MEKIPLSNDREKPPFVIHPFPKNNVFWTTEFFGKKNKVFWGIENLKFLLFMK